MPSADTRERDENWIRAFQGGDGSVFQKLYLAYLPPLFSFIKRHLYCDDAAAEDLCQDIMMTVYEKLPGFLFKAKFSTYLYTIALNRLRNVKRKKTALSLDEKIPGDGEASFLDGVVEPGTPHQGMFGRQVHELLKTGMETLPEKEREVFALKEFDELTFEEISEITGQSLRNIQYLKEKAQKRLKEYFEQNGILWEEVRA